VGVFGKSGTHKNIVNIMNKGFYFRDRFFLLLG